MTQRRQGASGKRLGMGNELGNPVIDRQRDSRQRRLRSWHPRLKSFGTTVIEIAETENYALWQCLCDPGLYPCATSTRLYQG